MYFILIGNFFSLLSLIEFSNKFTVFFGDIWGTFNDDDFDNICSLLFGLSKFLFSIDKISFDENVEVKKNFFFLLFARSILD